MKRQKKRITEPPPGLSWPVAVGGHQIKSAAINVIVDNPPQVTREYIYQSSQEKNIARNCINSNDTRSWVDKHRPNNIEDLCVAPRRVQDIHDWLTSRGESSSKSPLQQKGMLVLVGTPGVGKSTTIRTLCHKLRYKILEWSEPSMRHNIQNTMFPTQSPLDSWEEFLRSAGLGYRSLLGISNGGNIYGTCNEDTVVENGEAYSNHGSGTRMKVEGNESNVSLIMIKDIPYLHTPEAHQRFR